MIDLDDELRRLLADADERLDVPVRPDAPDVIVAGAKRVRRRRVAAAAATGALTAVALVAGVIILVGGKPDAMPPALRYTHNPPVAATTTTTTGTTTSRTSTSQTTQSSATGTREVPPPPEEETRQTESSAPQPPKLDLPVLGPTGFQSLGLGQTLEQAQATGMVGVVNPETPWTSCTEYQLLVDGAPAGHVYFSTGGLLATIAPRAARTPEGVGPGWTVGQAQTVYPDFDAQAAMQNGNAEARVPGNGNATFLIVANGEDVLRVLMQTAPEPCLPPA